MNNETTNTLTKFLLQNWTFITGIAATIAYISEKIITFYTNSKKKKEAYNNVFSATIKLYLSYQKHKTIYQEETVFGLPDEIFVTIAKHLDTFNDDIERFKKTIEEETNIIPEISLSTYSMFYIIDRFRVIDRISSSDHHNTEISDIEKLTIRRAQFFAFEEFMSEFFKDVIEQIRKETLVKKDFAKRLFYLESEEYQHEAFEEQVNLMKRYYESLHRQGGIPDEVYQELLVQISHNLRSLPNS